MRAWGEPYNDMINIYVKSNSAQMQIDQQAKNGQQAHVDVGEVIEPRKIKILEECPHCHKNNFAGGTFCSFCGKSFAGEPNQGEVAIAEQNQKLERDLRLFLRSSANSGRISEVVIGANLGLTQGHRSALFEGV